MNGKYKYMVVVSKKAYHLVEKGNAVIQAGGIRDLGGRLVEMALPATDTAVKAASYGSIGPAGVVLAGLDTVSSVANNIQSGFIQRGVNKANVKLDQVLINQKGFLSGMKLNAILGVTSLALEFVNIGISLKNFSDIKVQINDAKNQIIETNGMIRDLYDHIDQQKLYDYIREYETQILHLENAYEMYCHNDIKELEKILPIQVFDPLTSYINLIIRLFNERKIDSSIGCNIIFGIVPAYTNMVKLYSEKYYFEYHKLPSIYYQCGRVLESLGSETFKNEMKKYLIIECDDSSPDVTYEKYEYLTSTIKAETSNYKFTEILLKNLPQKEYEALDSTLTNKIRNHDKDITTDGYNMYIPLPL